MRSPHAFVSGVVLLASSLFAPRSALAAPPAAERPWTFLIYAAVDNNADGPFLEFLAQVCKAWDEDPGIEIIAFVDRHDGFFNGASILGDDFADARLYRMRKGSAERLDGGAEFPEIKLDGEYEANSADPVMLRKFIAFAKRAFPAKRYGLMIYSHANGMSMCPDMDSKEDMGIAAVTDFVGPAEAVDFMGLELCNMSGLEIAYQWRPGNGGFTADTLVAIPNAGPPLAWERVFARLRTRDASSGALPKGCIDPRDLDAPTFGRMVIEEGATERSEHGDEGRFESAASLDLNAAGPAKEALDALAVALAESDAKKPFEALRGPGAHGVVMNYVEDDIAARGFVDAYALAKRIAASDAIAPAARAAAEVVMARIDDLVDASFGMSGYQGFEPGKNGVFIVCPAGTSWWTYDWYGPGPHDKLYGRWSATKDGATEADGKVENWFELLDSWFDTQTEKGGANRYRV